MADTADVERLEGVPADAVAITSDGGLYKKILVAGDSSEGTPLCNHEVQVHYVGTLLSDGSKFDSSRDRPGNFSFKIGMGQVIKGWDQGVIGMHKGEKAELFCRADYAYGERGSPPKIPPNATLKFEVELFSFGEPAKQKWEMSAKEKLEKAREHKAKGGEKFKGGEWLAAQTEYDEGAKWVVDSVYEFVTDEDKKEAADLHASCALNTAMCALKLGDYPAVIASCTTVLPLENLSTASRVKALFRRGTARIKMGDFADARADLKEANSLDPKSKEVREAYASIKAAEAEAKQKDKGLFANMLKGAGGVKQKRPEGVPADAVDLSDDGGLCKRVLKAGDPSAGTPPQGCKVQVHYTGTLLSDGSKFDSSRDRAGNFSFHIGLSQVIKGWDQGVITMHKGEVAELFCRADYAYGESGSPPKIPGGAVLKFEVELLSWGEPPPPVDLCDGPNMDDAAQYDKFVNDYEGDEDAGRLADLPESR